MARKKKIVGPSHDALPPWARESEFVCVVPKALGAPTKLKMRGQRVVCETESGIEMIVPVK